MIKMYGFWRSAASFRVRMALNLKGLAYAEEMVNLDADEQHTSGYRTINPQSDVPSVYIDGGPPLTQSIAILEYLEDIHPEPALLPTDARGRARVRALSLLWAADHHPLIVPRVRRYLTEELKVSDATRSTWLRHWFREGLVLGEAALKGDLMTRRYCHGDTLTHADLCLMSQAMAARHSGVDFSDLPVLNRIVSSCLEIDAISQALPLKQRGAPPKSTL